MSSATAGLRTRRAGWRHCARARQARQGVRRRLAVSDRDRRRGRCLRSARRGRGPQLLGRRSVTGQRRPRRAARPNCGPRSRDRSPACSMRSPPPPSVLAHHSFHVFVVYPWVRFLDRDAATALQVMQDCRIRWGTVESVAGDHAVISSRPLQFDRRRLALGEPRPSGFSGRRAELSLAPAPAPGSVVSAHWDWVCGTLTDDENAGAGVGYSGDAGAGQCRPLRTAFPWPQDRSTLVS